MAPRKLDVAVSGLGRMGARHAQHFLNLTPRANLVAAFSPDEKELAWARQHLEPHGVVLYRDYDVMLRHPSLEAVVVSTVTTVHAEQAIKAIEAGMHVLCEKPLSTSADVSRSVLDVAQRHPHLKVLTGFSRRFDASYRHAHSLVRSGHLGTPTIVRSQTCDKLDPSGFFVDYAQFSGGIFVDCNIHDVDLALWFFGDGEKDAVTGTVRNLRVKSVSAVGVTAVQPGLAKWGDVDNGVGVVEFHGGLIAYFFGSRMMAAGQHDMTEIIGTAGKITVNGAPAIDLVEMHEKSGVRREIAQDYYGRFREAFVTEANEFVECVLDGKELPFRLEGAVKAVEIAGALQESLREGRRLVVDVDGRKVEKARL